jgi:hypothetical protein
MRLVEIWASGFTQKRVNLHAGLGVMAIDLTSVLGSLVLMIIKPRAHAVVGGRAVTRTGHELDHGLPGWETR